jgi:hypothetical protein
MTFVGRCRLCWSADVLPLRALEKFEALREEKTKEKQEAPG